MTYRAALAGMLLAVVVPTRVGLAQDPAGAVVRGVVRDRGAPIQDAVVYLTGPSTLPAAPDTVTIDQRGFQFVPRVLVISPGSVVVFLNSDPNLHNVFSPGGKGAAFDLGTYPRTELRRHTFTAPGAQVILCHVHPEMVAYVLVVPTPYRAVVNEDGSFRIEGVAPDSYRLNVWRRRSELHSRPIVIRADAQRAPIEIVLP